MAWVEEAWNSRSYNGGEIEFVYLVGDTVDDATAILLAAGAAPTTYQSIFYRQSNPECKRVGNATWRVAFRYKVPEGQDQQQQGTGYEYEFDTGGLTRHIQTALADVAKYPNDAPAINGAINWVNGHAQGIEVQVPAYTWSERRQFGRYVINDGYRATLKALTGKVNGLQWRIFQRGEVLFKGARGRYSDSSGVWDITYSFAASDNFQGRNVMGQSVSGEGWHHITVRTREADDQASGNTKPELIGAYVQQVLPYANFGALGI